MQLCDLIAVLWNSGDAPAATALAPLLQLLSTLIDTLPENVPAALPLPEPTALRPQPPEPPPSGEPPLRQVGAPEPSAGRLCADGASPPAKTDSAQAARAVEGRAASEAVGPAARDGEGQRAPRCLHSSHGVWAALGEMIHLGAALPMACAACEAIVLATQSRLSSEASGLREVVDGPWWKGGELLIGLLRMLKHAEEELGELPMVVRARAEVTGQ